MTPLEVFQAYRRQIYRIALAITHDHHKAEDVCQEVATKILGKYHQLRSPEAERDWVRAIARNTAISHRKAYRQESPTETIEREDGRDTLAELDRSEELRAAMTDLDDIGREVIQAYYFDGMDTPQLAERLGVPKGTVRRRMCYARKHIRRRLTKRGNLYAEAS